MVSINNNINKYLKKKNATEKMVARLKQWMEGRGYVVPLGVWCQHTDVHLPYVGRRGAAERDREGAGGGETITKDIAERNLRRCLRSGGGNKR